MSAGTYNITIEQGATFSKTIYYKNNDGTPIDLTDVTAVRAQMRATVDAATKVDFTAAVSGDATLGVIAWSLTATQTAALVTPFTRVYDLEIEFDTGEVRRLLQGSVTISQEVTR